MVAYYVCVYWPIKKDGVKEVCGEGEEASCGSQFDLLEILLRQDDQVSKVSRLARN